MKGIPSLMKFEYNESSKSYEKRIIHNDKVYRILIPLRRWDARSRQNIHYWFKTHKDPPLTTFPFGDINHEQDVNINDVLNNRCEYCGRKMKNLKNKRNHMANCKHRLLETQDEEYKITHKIENKTIEETIEETTEETAYETAYEPTTSPGIVYLVQPGNLKGTNRYKFGCSKSQTFRRCNGYGLETKVVLVLKVDDPHKAETFILREICKKYKPYYGNEWFAGDEDVIYNDVFEAFNEYRKLI